MIGKITAVLAKKEAEAYRSQGLHCEAKNLYIDLLSSSPNIAPSIRSAIQSQIQDIDQEIESTATTPRRQITKEEIVTMRDGWGDSATETDTLICAQAFYQIGAFDQAMEELVKLLATLPIKKQYVTLAADCLTRLHPPKALPDIVAQTVARIGQPHKMAIAIKVAMAKHMESQGNKDHALALYTHLKQVPGLADGVQEHIDRLRQKST